MSAFRASVLPKQPSGTALSRAVLERGRILASAELAVWPRTSRLLPWGLASFLAMVWLLPFDSASLPISLPLDAKLDRPLLLSLLGVWALALVAGSGVRWWRAGPVHWAIALFGLIAVASIVLNFEVLARVGDLEIALRKLAILVSYGVFFVVAASVIRASEVRRFIVFMVALASVTALGTLIEYRLGFNAFYTWTSAVLPGTGRPADFGGYDSIGRLTVVGPTIHPLAVATMMSLALPFAIVGLLDSPDRRSKALYALATGLMLGAAVATQRKSGLILPVVSLMVLLAYRPRSVRRLLPFALVLGILVHTMAPGALGSVVNQLKPGAVTGVLTTKDRTSDYDGVHPEIVNHPLLGRGYESYDQKRYRILDNEYLSLVVGVGLLGVVAYLGILGAAFVLAHRGARSGDPAIAATAVPAAAAIAALAVGSALLDTLALPQLPYLFAFIAALVVVATRTQKNGAGRTLPT